jgi:hypothetical protein
MTELSKDMKLLGLVMPEGDFFCSYFETLPEYFTQCLDMRDFYRLKKGKRVENPDNLEFNIGFEYLIRDPYAKKYFYRIMHEETNIKQIHVYFKDKNIFVLKDKYRANTPASPTKETNTDEEDDKTELIF